MQTNKLAEKPIIPLLFSMAYPPMISMLVQSLYNIVDSMFVARIGEDALTAVSLAFPLQFLILAVGLGTAVGTNSFISRKLGEEQLEKAKQAASHAIILALITYLFFVLVGLFGLNTFFQFFSDSKSIQALGIQYTQVVLFGCFGMLVHLVIEKTLQATGNMIYPMMILIFGAVCNIILDPIFIFGYFGIPAMGVRGAAIATIIGQCSSMVLSVFAILYAKNSIGLTFRGFRFQWEIVGQIYTVGVPTMLMNALTSLVVVGLNSILSSFSNTAVSVYGIYFKLQTFVYMPVSGLIQGAMPIMGYNYGANNRSRLLQTLRVALTVTFCIMACGTILFWVGYRQLLLLFHASDTMIALGRYTLRLISLGYIPATFGFLFATFFQAMGKGFYSLIIFLLRQLVVALPVAYFLAPRLGVNGVWLAFPAAEIVGAITAWALFYYVYKKDPIFHKSEKTS